LDDVRQTVRERHHPQTDRTWRLSVSDVQPLTSTVGTHKQQEVQSVM